MFNNKICLVTGAAQGIGKAITLRLAAQGAEKIYALDMNHEMLSSAYADHTNIEPVTVNICDRSAVRDLVESIAEQDGRIDVLVNNAGVTRDNLLLRMSSDEWQEVVDTNLNGAFRVTKAALRNMVKARWGRIINVGSVVARLGNPGQANYVSSKAGLEGFTRSLALEVGSRGITVNLLAPGFIETDMTAALSDEQTSAMLTRIPLGRMGQAKEVAAAVSFLSGGQAAYITGQTIHINGGMFLN